MRLHVEVTQEDIDKGCPGDPDGERGGCMIWRAFIRVTKGAFSAVHVGWDAIESKPKGSYLEPFWYSETDQKFIEDRISAFDSGKPVEPFAFDLELPDELLSGGSVAEVNGVEARQEGTAA